MSRAAFCGGLGLIVATIGCGERPSWVHLPDAGIDASNATSHVDVRVDVAVDTRSDSVIPAQPDGGGPTDAQVQTDSQAVADDARTSGDVRVVDAGSSNGWRTATRQTLPARAYFNCMSGDGSTVGYFLEDGPFTIHTRTFGSWLELETLTAAPLPAGNTLRCAFSYDGTLLVRASRDNAIVSTRDPSTSRFRSIAELRPASDTFRTPGGDVRVLMSSDGRRVVVSGRVGFWNFEDRNGAWQNWYRERLPDAFSPEASADTQVSATPTLDMIFATGASPTSGTGVPVRRAVSYERSNNTWRMVDRTSLCIAYNCSLNRAGTTVASCVFPRYADVAECAVRALSGANIQMISIPVSSLQRGAATFWPPVTAERHVQWAGGDVLFGTGFGGPPDHSSGSTYTIPIFGYTVFALTSDGGTRLAGGDATLGDFSTSDDGRTLLVTNSGSRSLAILER